MNVKCRRSRVCTSTARSLKHHFCYRQASLTILSVLSTWPDCYDQDLFDFDFWGSETFVVAHTTPLVGVGRLTIQSIYFPFWFWCCLGNKVICLTVVQVSLIAYFCPYFHASFNAIWPELLNFEHWGGTCIREWNADTRYLTWHCLHGVRGEGVQLTFIHTLGNCPVLSLLSKNTFKIK